MSPKYDVLLGCNYPPDDTRSEPGDVIDVPEAIGDLLVKADAARPHKPASGPGGKSSTDTTPKDSTKAPDGGKD